MQAPEFDLWRQEYANLTFAEHAAFYRRLHADHPDQRHFNAADALEFFEKIPSSGLYVLELGGYDGALAGYCLENSPKILYWDNFDIAPPSNSYYGDRYGQHELDVPLWDLKIPFEWDVFVGSHVIEHLSEGDLRDLLDYVSVVDWLYLDAPLHETQASDWTGGTCAHKLTLSWQEVDKLVEGMGFDRWPILGAAHCYRRCV